MVEIKMDGAGKNALGTDMLLFLREKLADAAGKPVLLTGSGDAFSAGLNLKEVASLDEEKMLEFLRLFEQVMTTLYLYPWPVVAAVNGHAIAGGCVLALGCDHRVMTSNSRAKIGLNESALGVRFPPRTFVMVRRRLSPQHADRLLLGAGLFAPDEALALGLVDEVTDVPMAAAQSRLATLASYPPDGYAQTKADLRGATAADLCPDDVHDRALREATSQWVGSGVKERMARALAR